MSDFDTSVVIQAYDGELFSAPVGTILPPDRTTALDVAFVSVGWLAEDGLTFTPGITADDPIKGWPRGEVLKRPKPTLEPEFVFKVAQHDADALDWVTNPAREMAVVLDYRDGVTADNYRLILPKVTLKDSGEMAFNTTDLVGIELTLGCARDDGAGYTFAFMIPDPTTPDTTVIKSY